MDALRSTAALGSLAMWLGIAYAQIAATVAPVQVRQNDDERLT